MPTDEEDLIAPSVTIPYLLNMQTMIDQTMAKKRPTKKDLLDLVELLSAMCLAPMEHMPITMAVDAQVGNGEDVSPYLRATSLKLAALLDTSSTKDAHNLAKELKATVEPLCDDSASDPLADVLNMDEARKAKG